MRKNPAHTEKRQIYFLSTPDHIILRSIFRMRNFWSGNHKMCPRQAAHSIFLIDIVYGTRWMEKCIDDVEDYQLLPLTQQNGEWKNSLRVSVLSSEELFR